ncbi:MAG: GNAT family N-acetyltransferase [Rhodospirillaceae bacterium]|nr:GNAT family N-acetyltransferase [Rhodospirillaceae bacterium]
MGDGEMSRKFTIQIASLDDAPAIHHVHESSILELGSRSYTLEEARSWAAGLSPDFYIRCIKEEGETFLVAAGEYGIVCAFASYHGDELTGLYVSPNSEGRGLGSALLQRAEQEMQSRGAERVQIKASRSGRKFYESKGYERVGTHQWKTRGGLEIEMIDMTKALRKEIHQ